MGTKKRVLIVDDAPGIGDFLDIKLRLSSYDVIMNTSGAEAIDFVSKEEPDILLSDALVS